MPPAVAVLGGAALGGLVGSGVIGGTAIFGAGTALASGLAGAGAGASLGGSLAGAFGQPSGLSSSNFGGGSPSPINVQTPGFEFVNGVLTRRGTEPQLEFARRFPGQLSEIDMLKKQVAPGASLFRTAAMGQLRSQEQAAVGNLREQLARRGLAGASFAQDTEGRVQAEFGQQRAAQEASIAGQELQMTLGILDFERQTITEALNRELTELGQSTGVVTSAAQIAAGNNAIQAQLAIAESQARSQALGSFGGTLLGLGSLLAPPKPVVIQQSPAFGF